MKLYIVQEDGESVRARSIKIYDDRGQRLPCITDVTIRHSVEDCTRLEISLVVDDRTVVFGAPPVESGEV